jgi:putative DNA methylase
MKSTLIAIVAEGKRSRIYLPPSDEHRSIAAISRPEVADIPLPRHPQYIGVLGYGFNSFVDLFTDRQLVALNTFSELVHEARGQIEQDALAAGLSNEQTSLRDGGTGAKAYAEAASVFLGFGVSKGADYHSTIATWHSGREIIRNTFGRQALPMTWDFAEANFFSASTGNWLNCVEWGVKFLGVVNSSSNGILKNIDAQTVQYPANTVISTDPPYYDNIGYADLSDFFFCWMKPALKDVYPDLFGVMATPKTEELVADRVRHGGKDKAEDFFLTGMGKAIKNMAEQSNKDIPATIYYAFKQSEVEQEGISSTGWATFLQAVIEAGYTIVGTWPMRTEMANRMRATGFNALANSVVLVCRKRGQAASSITRAEFIRELKRELPAAIEKLKAANIVPADIPQSSIGPGIGIFSRYTSVLESDDTPMSVKTALQLINAELGDSDGDFDADTSFALTWFEQHGFSQSDFGTANNIANAKGIAVESLVHAEVAESSGGKFRLLPRDEMDEGWDPRTDTHLTIWECCQHLIRVQQEEGDTEAAKLMKLMGPEKAEAAKELAYSLYEIATTKRNDAKEGTAYNGLIAAWSDISAVAASLTDEDFAGDRQMGLI